MPSLNQVWEYASEIVFAALVCVFVEIIWGASQTAQWIDAKRSDLFILLGIGITIAAAVFAGYVALLMTEFGSSLRTAGHAKHYTKAFCTPLSLLLFSLLLLLFVSHGIAALWLNIVAFFLIYAGINCFTMIRNIQRLFSVWQDVDRARKTGHT